MAFAGQANQQGRYGLRAQRPPPGSYREYPESENDDGFTLDTEAADPSCDTNCIRSNQKSHNRGWFDVESIEDHRTASDVLYTENTTTYGNPANLAKGCIEYYVKWEDWEDPTWEPEENLRDAGDEALQIIMEYRRSISRRTKGAGKKRRRRGKGIPISPTLAATNRLNHANRRDFLVEDTAELHSLLGSWKSEIRSIDDVDRGEDLLTLHVTWLNGRKTQLVVWGDRWDDRYGKIRQLVQRCSRDEQTCS